jgi:heme-degrading monooxygenase HmoA
MLASWTPPMPTLIDAFEVAPDADEAFLAEWERARDARRGFGATALHRALRHDVDFRFVEVALVDSPGAGRENLYEVVREDGTPEVEGGVVLIEPFEVPGGQDERFLAGWDRARDVLARQRGYIGARLYRNIGPGDFRFVDVARWSSPLMYARALQRQDFREAAKALPFASHPALYQVVRR